MDIKEVNKLTGIHIKKIDDRHFKIEIDAIAVKQRFSKNTWIILIKDNIVGIGCDIKNALEKMGYGNFNLRITIKSKIKR